MSQCGVELKHNGAIFYCIAEEGHPGLCTYIGLDAIPAHEVAALAREIDVLNHAICSFLPGEEWGLSREARREMGEKIIALLKLAEPENEG